MKRIALGVCIGVLISVLPARPGVVKRTDKYVRHAQVCQRITDRDRRPTPSRRLYARSGPGKFRNWAFRLWRGRARDACGKVRYLNAEPVRAIRYVFQRVEQAAKAISVVRCETGGKFNTTATNGQYENIFQMGLSERRRFGWHVAGSPPLDATWSAFFYWRVSGWSPWSCA